MTILELCSFCKSVDYCTCGMKCPLIQNCDAVETAIQILEDRPNWCMPIAPLYLEHFDTKLLERYGHLDIETLILLAEEKRKFTLNFGE